MKLKTMTQTSTKAQMLTFDMLKNQKLNMEYFEDNVEFQGYFWVQHFEPSKDPVKYMLKTERFNKWQYIVVNSESINFSESKVNSILSKND